MNTALESPIFAHQISFSKTNTVTVVAPENVTSIPELYNSLEVFSNACVKALLIELKVNIMN